MCQLMRERKSLDVLEVETTVQTFAVLQTAQVTERRLYTRKEAPPSNVLSTKWKVELVCIAGNEEKTVMEENNAQPETIERDG